LFGADREEAAMLDEQEEFKRFAFVAEDCKRYFGLWDPSDPVSWAILRVVQAQNDLSHAIEINACYRPAERAVEAAIAERLEAITALQHAIEEEPRGFQ
jgi:hypothetical protein